MENQINIASHPYGLGGGAILSGSMTVKTTDAFWYYPVTNTTADVKIKNLSGSFNGTVAFTAGIGVYGVITSVTQSTGISIVYSGSANVPRY